jgi:hypothetical protein
MSILKGTIQNWRHDIFLWRQNWTWFLIELYCCFWDLKFFKYIANVSFLKLTKCDYVVAQGTEMLQEIQKKKLKQTERIYILFQKNL